MGAKLKVINLITTGTGRCGTVYMAKLLSSLGISCGHESIFDFAPYEIIIQRLSDNSKRVISECSKYEFVDDQKIKNENWIDIGNIIADSSYMAAPYLNEEPFKMIPVIHVVRNPLQVISSFVYKLNYFQFNYPRENDPWEALIFKTLPGLSKITTQLERGCYFYTEWNNLIEIKIRQSPRPYFFSQIENIPSQSFYEFVNKFPTKIYQNKKANMMKIDREILKLNNIPNGQIKNNLVEKMRKYGYKVETILS